MIWVYKTGTLTWAHIISDFILEFHVIGSNVINQLLLHILMKQLQKKTNKKKNKKKKKKKKPRDNCRQNLTTYEFSSTY